MAPLTKSQAPHQLRYKTEQREVLHWMFKTASSLRKNDSSSTVDAILESPALEPTCIDIQTLATFIGERLHPVPDKILRSFDRVITDRKDTCRDYERSTANNTDPLIKQHNNMHRRWVVGLAIAFDSLGGKEWRARQGVSSVISKTGFEEYLFTNRFSALDLDEAFEEGNHCSSATQNSLATTSSGKSCASKSDVQIGSTSQSLSRPRNQGSIDNEDEGPRLW
ncbi:uncharacterized protein N7484_009920 [Penicillium longicatenatum]|uniref:uncharacterized protein n=1 Tax=Penicillium longicatenatum TaxID=1561947 RepID=UPI002548EB95|nr:uncharacterized protein N7484_009920 [Penicillium longicatenatum]KAJ5636607.1 hypothetical protein N7484_009920 [Penicillium longicatenatum]